MAELSVALGARIPRYPLWLCVHETGANPEDLSKEEVVGFCEGPLVQFLIEHRLWLSPRARRQLAKTVSRFDPTRPTPAERFATSDF